MYLQARYQVLFEGDTIIFSGGGTIFMYEYKRSIFNLRF